MSSKVFGNFVKMCSIHGLDHIVALALSHDAAEMAHYDIHGSGVASDTVKIIFDGRIGSYVPDAQGKQRAPHWSCQAHTNFGRSRSRAPDLRDRGGCHTVPHSISVHAKRGI